MDPYINLAKKSIEEYVRSGKVISPNEIDLPPEMQQKKAGIFVSLHLKENGKLRGCIGTFLPTKKNIAQEIIDNAISAATRDPRFLPVSKNELDKLEISVDVLNPPEFVEKKELLDPKKYGIIVRAEDGRTGLLLPDIEGVETIDDQIAIASCKAGIDPSQEKIQIYRFTVTRHK